MELSGDQLEVEIKTILGIGPRTGNPVECQQHEVIGIHANYYLMANSWPLNGVCMWVQTNIADDAETQGYDALFQLYVEIGHLPTDFSSCIANFAITGYAVCCGEVGIAPTVECVEWLDGELMEWEIQDYVDWVTL